MGIRLIQEWSDIEWYPDTGYISCYATDPNRTAKGLDAAVWSVIQHACLHVRWCDKAHSIISIGRTIHLSPIDFTVQLTVAWYHRTRVPLYQKEDAQPPHTTIHHLPNSDGCRLFWGVITQPFTLHFMLLLPGVTYSHDLCKRGNSNQLTALSKSMHGINFKLTGCFLFHGAAFWVTTNA